MLSYKAVLSRVTADGETCQIEVQAKDQGELKSKMAAASKVVDERLIQWNMRIAAAHQRMKALSHEERMAVHDVWALLTGTRLPQPGELGVQIVTGIEKDSATEEYDAKHGRPGGLHPGVEQVTPVADANRVPA